MADKKLPTIPEVYKTSRAQSPVKKFMDFKDENGKIKCLCCNKPKNADDFYKSTSVLYKGIGFLPVCKGCLADILNFYKTRHPDEETSFYYFCRLIDVAYVKNIYAGVAGKPNLIGEYMKKVNGATNSKNNTRFDDSDVLEKKLANGNIAVHTDSKEQSFQITPEMRERWKGDVESDIPDLEKFYQDMARDNRVEVAQDKAYLRLVARTYVKTERALQGGNIADWEKLSKSFSLLMKDFKLRPADKTAADRTGGIVTFGQIYSKVEEPNFVPPWTKLGKTLGADQDIVDRTIQYILNFILRLLRMSRMATPPMDTPKIGKEEIDPDSKKNANYSEFSIDVSKDEDLSDRADDEEDPN